MPLVHAHATMSRFATDAEYLAALDELDALMLVDPDSPAGRRFDELVAQIDAWELERERAGREDVRPS